MSCPWVQRIGKKPFQRTGLRPHKGEQLLAMIAQWSVRVFKEIVLSLGSNPIRKIAAKRDLGRVFGIGQRLRDEASIVQPRASVARGGQWWDLSQSPVFASQSRFA